MKGKFGMIAYPHRLKSPQFELSLNIKVDIGSYVSQSRDTKIHLAFVESNSLIPQDDEDD